MSNPTEAEYIEMLQRMQGFAGALKSAIEVAQPIAAKVRQPRTGYRSKVEARYAQYLELQVKVGAIKSWLYEPITLKLAPGVRYQPDFLVINNDNEVSLFETKGRKGASFWSMPVSKIKYKLAADLYPWWRFYVTWPKANGEWESIVVPRGV